MNKSKQTSNQHKPYNNNFAKNGQRKLHIKEVHRIVK